MVDVTVLATAGFFIASAILLGYLGQKELGVFLLGFAALIASIVSAGGAELGYEVGGQIGAWIGLILGMSIAAWIVPWILCKILRVKSGRFITAVWVGFCILSIYGYLAGDWLGLLTITLPTVVVFWVGLYLISAYILPLRDASQRRLAFRSLVTFNLGTNFPYFFVDEHGKPDKRVDGNPFRHFFAGPGFVYTPPDHAAYVTNGVANNRVAEPGLTFTQQYDLDPEIVDLRTQLRTFDVEAQTKDGIPIKVLVFVPFRIDTGNQRVELGEGFPFRPAAIYKALANELTERKSGKEDPQEKYEWDGKLVQVVTTPIMQDIISHYTVDELCEPNNSTRDPRVEIVDEMKRRVEEALRPRGLEIVGGGISNLLPQEENIMQRRLENWKTRWQGRIQAWIAEGQANRARVLEGAKAKAGQDKAEYLAEVTKANPLIINILKYLNTLPGPNPTRNSPDSLN
jgi:regulator of protease activity HflC (stomatin/prohibitin superfamily)